MYLKYHIKQFERGLKFRRGDFIRPLAPGKHRLWIWNVLRDRIEIVSTLKTKFEHALLEVLVKNEQLRAQLEILDLTDNQRALVWKDGRLLTIVGPAGTRSGRSRPRLRSRPTTSTFRFTHPQLATIVQARGCREVARWRRSRRSRMSCSTATAC